MAVVRDRLSNISTKCHESHICAPSNLFSDFFFEKVPSFFCSQHLQVGSHNPLLFELLFHQYFMLHFGIIASKYIIH